MNPHRAPARPRYGRMATFGAAMTVTVVAALAGLGVFASGATPPAHPSSYLAGDATGSTTQGTTPVTTGTTGTTGATPPDTSTPQDHTATQHDAQVPVPTGIQSSGPASQTAVPVSSGHGRRIVFSQHLQRVWLLGKTDNVRKTYLVSGSVTDNLQPGSYSVYSKSRRAVGVDDSGVMQYFVRFTQGPTGAAIGFHSIPTKDGVPVQTTAQLGTPASHGCIRQWKPDALALWHFAPVGTKVVVVA
jgi:hypothetical protein